MKHGGSINANKIDQWEIEMEQIHPRKMCTEHGTEEKTLEEGQWVIDAYVGKGLCGEVYDCHRHKSDAQQIQKNEYVVKILKKKNDKSDQVVAKEVAAMQKLKSISNIVRYVYHDGVKHDETGDTNRIFMKKVNGKTLHEVMLGKPSDADMDKLLRRYGTKGSQEREDFVIAFLDQII